MHILIATPLNEQQEARMLRIAGDDRAHFIGEVPDDATVHEVFGQCEVVFSNVPAHWLTQTAMLRWAQLESVGFGEYEHLDWDQLGQQITMTNMAGFFTAPVAETALAGILALYRGIDEVARLKPLKNWQKDRQRSKLRLLQGTRVVLGGYGSIARRIAALLKPFDCRITSYDLPGTDADINTTEELDGVLADADVVVVALPESSQTVNLFDQRRLAMLSSTAVFVNIGRSSVIDESALVAALQAERIGGAVLDVTAAEPLPTDHPLWDCPNTILTQHTAGGTIDEIDRKITFFENNLNRYRSGLPLESVIDWTRGF